MTLCQAVPKSDVVGPHESFSIKSSIQLGNGHPDDQQHNFEPALRTLNMPRLEELVKGRFPEYFYKPKVRPIIAKGINLGWYMASSASL